MIVTRREFLKLTAATGAGLLLGLRQPKLVQAGQETLHVLSDDWQPCDVYRPTGELVGRGDFYADFHAHSSGQVDGEAILILNEEVENRWQVQQLEVIRFDEPTGSVWSGKGWSIRGNERVQTDFILTMTSIFSPSTNDPPTPIFDIVGGGDVYENMTGPSVPLAYTFTGPRVRHFFKDRRE